MRRIHLILFVSFALVAAIATAHAQQQTEVVTVRTLGRIELPKTRMISSALDELTPQAMDMGLGDAELIGRISTEKLPNKQIRVRIVWNGIRFNSSATPATSSLPSPLVSQFRTDEKDVETDTKLKAKGNLDALARALVELRKGMDKKDIRQKETTLKEIEEENGRQASALAPSGSSASGNYGGDDDWGGNDSVIDTEVPEEKVTTQEQCDYGVDLDNHLLLVRRKEIVKTASGETVSVGECVETGESIPMPYELEDCQPRKDSANHQLVLQQRKIWKDLEGRTLARGDCEDTTNKIQAKKVYGTPCNNLPDYDEGKVFQQYQWIAEHDGKQFTVNDCLVDYDENFFDITPAYSECSVRHDFQNNVTIQQARLSYTNADGELKFLTECKDTEKVYPHYEVRCSELVDWQKGIVIPQTRLAYDADDGETYYATSCQPVPNTQYAIQEEYCEPKYDHDIVGNQSYVNTKHYFIEDNQKRYISDCKRSGSVSYQHMFDETLCSMVNDDESMTTQLYAKRYIETPDDGRIDIGDCEPYGEPVPYAYLGTKKKEVAFKKSGEWTVPEGVTRLHIVAVAQGGRGGNGGKAIYSECDEGYAAGEGNGGSYDCRSYGCMSCYGGGGGGGQIIEQDVSVQSGETIKVEIDKNTNIHMQNRTILAQYGQGARGNNANGNANLPGEGGAGYLWEGTEYGKGGRGGLPVRFNKPDHTKRQGLPGSSGLVLIQYDVRQWRRHDGTILEKI